MRCNMSYQSRKLLIGATVISHSGVAGIIDNPENPANQAYNWIVDDDPMQLCPGDSSLSQRYILALLYFTTQGDNWTKCRKDGLAPCAAENFLSGTTECEWGGVSCDSSQQVTKLNLGKHIETE